VAEPQKPPLSAVRLFASSAERRRNLTVLNARRYGLKDLYYGLLQASWASVVAGVVVVFGLINALFGLLYWRLGGVAGATSYLDHFFFSVHTFGTIGYGSMYPQSTASEVVMSFEAVLSLLLNAMVTGLAFAKFARPTARVLWSNVCCISDRDGVPTLMFRVANERMNHVVEANIRAAVLRSETTLEGERLRRIIDLPLVRSSSPSFILTWTVMHQITKDSPLYGLDLEGLQQRDIEIVLTLTGLDETLAQTIHARTSFLPQEVVFGARFQDVLGWTGEGERRRRALDYGHFHQTVPAPLNAERMGIPRVEAPAAER
jgi:inward rectifier potassium channel